MKPFILLLIVAGILLFVACYTSYRKEHFEQEEDSMVNPFQLGKFIIRPSNTILTASVAPLNVMLDDYKIPDKYENEFNEWIEKGFISPVKDQMLCGACWAFAACAALADRISIITAGQWYAPFGLSEQYVTACGKEMTVQFYFGCQGGIPEFTFDAFLKNGVPADSRCTTCGGTPVQPTGNGGASSGGASRSGVVNPNDTGTCNSGGDTYAATDHTWWQTGCATETSCNFGNTSSCPCAQVSSKMKELEDAENTPFDVKYKTIGKTQVYTVHDDEDNQLTIDLWPDLSKETIKKNAEKMKKAIYFEGSVTVGYRVTADFYKFWETAKPDNFYRYDGRSPMTGGHAVCIVGWKTIDGTPVWICKNSWGENSGYGFTEPKWISPVTGQEEAKYMGGFWNHVMGENDSYIESTCSSGYPDISIPTIAQYIPKDVPRSWFNQMTIREVYEKTLAAKGGTIEPGNVGPKPIPDPGQTNIVPVEIKSTDFNIVTTTPENITYQSTVDFFKQGGLYLVGAGTQKDADSIVKLLPKKAFLSDANVQKLVDDIKSGAFSGQMLVAARGNFATFYSITGDPTLWDVFTSNYVNRSADLNTFARDMFLRAQILEYGSTLALIKAK